MGVEIKHLFVTAVVVSVLIWASNHISFYKNVVG